MPGTVNINTKFGVKWASTIITRQKKNAHGTEFFLQNATEEAEIFLWL
jgi:hypothetical protein